LSGCAKSPDFRLQTEAAERQGTAAAGVTIEKQPRQCGEDWPLLPLGTIGSHDPRAGVKLYERYITGEINPQKRRCFRFNDDQRSGLLRGE
jgi:hypothetical protein